MTFQSDPAYLAPAPGGALRWGPLTEGILLKRHHRFLADVEVEGRLVTAHTANTGRMTGCSEPGRPVWLSRHDRPGRRHPFTWEMIAMPGTLVGVNTIIPNKLAARAAKAGLVAEMGGPAEVETEVRTGRSRLDLRLTGPDGRAVMVEVKNCSLAENGIAYFPDAVTARGARHLEELAALAREGQRAALLIVVQRGDARLFRPADHIDPEWGKKLRLAARDGVEVWAYRAEMDLTQAAWGPRLPVELF